MPSATIRKVAFAVESIAATWEEAAHLMYAHHKEVGCLPQERFRPDRAFYLNLESHGILSVFTMRDSGKLVGYAVFATLPRHPHYEHAIWARQDSLYVDKSHRGVNAAEFMRWQDRRLRAENPTVEIVRQTTPRKDFGSLLELMGYRHMETAWILDREEVKLG